MLAAFVMVAVIAAQSWSVGAVGAAIAEPRLAVAAESVIVSFDRASPVIARLVLARQVIARHDDSVVFANGSGFATTLDAREVAELLRTPGVLAVTPNRVLQPHAAPHLDQTGAPVAWASGWRGEGQTIVVIDTGVDAANPNLVGKVVAEACFTPARGAGGDCPNGAVTQAGVGAATPCTGRVDCSHGTHVASVAAGGGPVVYGVAPGANIAAVQVFSSAKDASDRVVTDEASLVRALEWVDSVRATQPIAAVNLSLGGGPIATPCDASPALLALIDRLTAAGVAIVASAGNDASTSMLSFPACLPRVISVGSEGQAGRTTSFTNVAQSLTLFAPGESIEGAWSTPCCTRTLSGTSFAAPQVAAAFALMRQQRGAAPIDEQLALLRRTGDPVFATGPEAWSNATALRVARALDPQYQSARPAVLPRRVSPFGSVDAIASEPTGVRVSGWALDPDTAAPVTVHAYVDGVFAATAVAARVRPDVGAVFAGYGNARGFEISLTIARGDHTVCVYGLDLGAGQGNVLLGCRLTSFGRATGALDIAIAAAGTITASGWAIDGARVAPTTVELLVDGVVASTRTADMSRSDVAAAYPAYGAAHGYSLGAAATPGVHRVCVSALAAVVEIVGCRDLDMPSGLPVGVIDIAVATASGIVAAGWVIDPDTTASVDVVIEVDGVSVVAPADRPRPDLVQGAPGYGVRHGFQVTVAAVTGPHLVCVFGVDAETRGRSLVGCVVVTVA